MKQIFIILLSSLCICAKAQVNLVPNPSFEDTLGCPMGPDELSASAYWSSYRNSPDFFYGTCPMSVPNNWGGFQPASSGCAYVAIGTYLGSDNELKEHIGCQLISNLVTGTKYFTSFKLSLSLGYSTDANCASSKTGILFSTIPYDILHPSPINNAPHVYSDSIITDSIGWTMIFGSFIADSNYNFLILGNFFDNSQTDTIKYYNTFSDAAYYFVDDVCVSTDSSFAANYHYTNVPETDSHKSIIIYPNPVKSYAFIKGIDEPFYYTVTSINGKEILYGNNNSNSINLDFINAGSYIITISLGNTIIKRLIIKT